jgi:hypothetical protein
MKEPLPKKRFFAFDGRLMVQKSPFFERGSRINQK